MMGVFMVVISKRQIFKLYSFVSLIHLSVVALTASVINGHFSIDKI